MTRTTKPTRRSIDRKAKALDEQFFCNADTDELVVSVSKGEARVFPQDWITMAEILDAFRNAGFEVTEEALWHNYNAWHADMKSNFVQENGLQIFTPCRCNPLSFWARKVEKGDKTYAV